jgi:CheY-like chemotaxis protein
MTPMRILLVDDEPILRITLRALLHEHVRAEIVEATSGEEGRWHLQQRGFDIVISDHWMENGHGFELLRFVQQNPQLAYFFIMFTADEEILKRIPQDKRFAGVAKPDVFKLLECVTEACCINLFS